MSSLTTPRPTPAPKSPTQVEDLENIVCGAVLGMAGPGQQIAAIMPCTAIEVDDLSDRMLDRKRHPEWQGERTKALYGWPYKPDPANPHDGALKRREELWEHYAKVRSDALFAGTGNAPANEFYVANREAMDFGLTAAWPARQHACDVSPIQTCRNLLLNLKEKAFAAEHQNEPLPRLEASSKAVKPAQVQAKANGLARGVVPVDCSRLVAMIDVQKELLFYEVLALENDFTGHICDYGTYPDQHDEEFTKARIRFPLCEAENTGRFEESLAKGLNTLASLILGREWIQRTAPARRSSVALSMPDGASQRR